MPISPVLEVEALPASASPASRPSARKLLYLMTEDWYFCSHRLMLARAAMRQGFDVIVAARVDAHAHVIRNEGFKLIPLRMRRESKNLWHELSTVWQLIGIYRRERPDIVHQVALKPILYGSLAALFTPRTKIVNVLAGFGFLGTSSSSKARILRPFVQAAFKLFFNLRRSTVIVHNQDDYRELSGRVVSDEARIALIRGNGVDTELFQPTPQPAGIPIVVLPARMLWNKGIREFYEAARLLLGRGVQARFALIGKTDDASPSVISQKQLEDWVASGVLEWWGHCEHMPAVYRSASIVCLPSYREGIPKVLLEAAASGRAIVATDVPGCREIVRHQENGLLVPVKNPQALADALERLLSDPLLREVMGRRGREITVNNFSSSQILWELVGLYQKLADNGIE